MQRSSNGFTLIELMVVIVLLGLVAGIAIPSFNDLIQSNRQTALTNSMVGLLSFARSEAIRRGESVTVTASGNAFQAQLGDGTVIRQLEDAEPGQISQVTGGSNTVFRATGLITAATNVNFTICAKSGSQPNLINVNRGGQVTQLTSVGNCP